jgi:photosystem I subunit 10
MLVCNLFAILVLSRTIRRRGVGPALPFAAPGLPDGFGIPELLATTSFGHILGAGAILGLTNAGIL